MSDEQLLQSRHGFRMEVRKGRGSAGADVDALTPAAAAPHSDAFRVTTLASDYAWGRPIMDVPTGRHQKFNQSSRTTDKGRLTVRLLDEALDPDDQNVRWVTAFLNTPDGKDQLAGLFVQLWETHDSGGTWSEYFAGRVNGDAWEQGTTVFRIDLNDLSGDLEFDIFVGIPHPDANGGVRYAYPQPCSPLGIPFDYLGLAPVGPMRGLAMTEAGKRILRTDSKYSRQRRASVHEAFKGLADDVIVSTPVFDFLPQYALAYNGDQCHAYVVAEGTATEYGPYPLRFVDLWEPSDATDQHYRIRGIWAEGFDDGLVDGAASAAHPALSLGTWYTWRVVRNGAVDKTFPMLVGQTQGIHAVQYFKDIAQGYFGRMDPATGNPAYSMAIDEDAFDALIADPTFERIHDMPDKVWSAIDYIEDVICQTASLGWRLDGAGRVVPIDLRLVVGQVAAFSITEGDLTDSPDAFVPSGEKRDAITAVNAKYYADQQLSLDAEKGTGEWTTVPATYIESHEIPLEFADFTAKARDIGDQPIDWDAQGLRIGIRRDGRLTSSGAIVLSDAGRRAAVVSRMLMAIAERRRPFRSKPNTYTVEVDRTEAIDAITIGQYGLIQADQLVDPDTHARGGTRLGLCLSVTDVDAVTATLDILDVGPADLVTDPENPTPLGTEPPVLDNYQGIAGSPAFVQVDATLNAAGDPIMFRVAQTETSVATVGDVPDSAWALFGTTNLTRTVTFGAFGGPRLWLQGRSEPSLGSAGSTVVPSAWVSPLNAEYIDLDALDPPTSPAVSDVSDTRARFSWVPAADGYPLQVWYGAGTLDGTSLNTDGRPVASLPPNSLSIDLTGLDGPGVAVTVGVRHVDPAGGRVSSFAFVNFVTGIAGSLVAPRIAGIGLLGDA